MNELHLSGCNIFTSNTKKVRLENCPNITDLLVNVTSLTLRYCKNIRTLSSLDKLCYLRIEACENIIDLNLSLLQQFMVSDSR
jgi:hypothetical protein